MDPTDVLARVSAGVGGGQPAFRPDVPHDSPIELIEIMEKCWADSAQSRPTFADVQTQIGKIDSECVDVGLPP